MKKILRFSCIYFCFISICFGQVTDVVSDLSNPNGLLIDQGKLYIAESGKDRVVSVLLESTQVNLTEVATDVLFPIGLEKYMNQLLISENDGGRF
jgi:sugar lactone lactonase YvrE